MVSLLKKCPVQLLNGIRWKNLIIILLFFLLLYFRLSGQGIPIKNFTLLVISVLLIAAGGNLENDLKDRVNDRLNRKTNFFNDCMSKKFNLLPYLLYSLGILTGYWFSLQITHPVYIFYFIAVSILLINYNYALKKMPLIGNVIISLLTALVVWQILFFFSPGLFLARFLFLLGFLIFFVNLNREIIKDILDRKGDRLAGFQTLGIISTAKAIRITMINFYLLILFFISLIFILKNRSVMFYFIGLTAFYVWGTYQYLLKNINLRRLSKFYKWIILAGTMSIILV